MYSTWMEPQIWKKPDSQLMEYHSICIAHLKLASAFMSTRKNKDSCYMSKGILELCYAHVMPSILDALPFCLSPNM